MQVAAVGMSAAGQPVLLLQDATTRRYLPIWIGTAEAGAIALASQGVLTERPLTHTLIIDVAQALGHRLRQVLITGLQEGIFLAELVFTDGTRVSARPSDAVALAVRAGAAIHADDDLLAEAAVPADQVQIPGDDTAEQDTAAQVEQFRTLLDQARPEDFGQQPGDPDSDTGN
ncbi:MAG: bifunctional nuclease family protein [Pseudonocardiaceae bacterium]|nr:bifunctional nuclease family protein [Pseudonocardiaceae bacterium]